MDTHRRRKTVIAGTFANDRKSLSNAQPISADETQRTKAEMTMASTHMPTLHEAGAEGIYARVANQVFHSVEAVGPGYPRTWKARQDRRGGKNGRSAAPLPFRPRRLPFFFSKTPPIF
jgi:hypothetical protein